MQIRHRRARPEDIARGRKVLERDRVLFSPRVWQKLPELLADLLSRERILLCPLEDVETGQMVGMGASGFLRADFLAAALAAPGGFTDFVFAAELEGAPAFLNRKQVAEANRASDLRLLNFFGVPEVIDFNDARTLQQFGSYTDAWNFYHKGFALREIWFECTLPVMVQATERIGLRAHRESALPNGRTAKLFVINREEALQSTPSWPGSAMISPSPRFGFTNAEQQLLELALLDHTDREAADALGLSAEAIKTEMAFDL